MAIFQGVQGTLYRELGRHEHATDMFQAAYESLIQLGDRRFQTLILARIGALAADRGD